MATPLPCLNTDRLKYRPHFGSGSAPTHYFVEELVDEERHRNSSQRKDKRLDGGHGSANLRGGRGPKGVCFLSPGDGGDGKHQAKREH